MKLTDHLLEHFLDSKNVLLVNALSGAIDIVDHTTYEEIKNPERLLGNPELLAQLRERRYIFGSESEEMSVKKSYFEKLMAHRKPPVFVICPTYGCNFGCAYCFESNTSRANHELLSLAQIDAIFAAIPHLTNEQPLIQLFGGEPFLPRQYELVRLILAKADESECKISAITNGYNLLAFLPLLKLHLSRVEDIQVTLDGPEEIHNSRRPLKSGGATFSKIVEGIHAALELGIKVRLRVNVDQRNIGALPRLAEFFSMRQWDAYENFRAVLAPVEAHDGRSQPDKLGEIESIDAWLALSEASPEVKVFKPDLFRRLDPLYNALISDMPIMPRFWFCESNNLDCFTFGPDSLIYPCPEAVGNPDIAIGSYSPELVLNDKLASQWNNRNIFSLEECATCAIATFCGGGCAFAAFKSCGSAARPHCDNALETVRLYFDHIKESLLGSDELVVGNRRR